MDANASASNRTYGSTAIDVPEFSGVIDEACAAERQADAIHNLLDDLEMRLFGPEPKLAEAIKGGVAGTGPMPPPVLAHTVRHTRQRVESAASRIGRIVGRL